MSNFRRKKHSFFGILNAIFINKDVTFWRFKHQKYFLKIKHHFWHFKFRHLAFFKLTPDQISTVLSFCKFAEIWNCYQFSFEENEQQLRIVVRQIVDRRRFVLVTWRSTLNESVVTGFATVHNILLFFENPKLSMSAWRKHLKRDESWCYMTITYTVGIWISDWPGSQMVKSCLITEWSSFLMPFEYQVQIEVFFSH